MVINDCKQVEIVFFHSICLSQARNDHQQLLYEAQLNGPTRMFPGTGPPPPQLPQAHPPPPQLAIMQQPVDLQQRSQVCIFIFFIRVHNSFISHD